MSRPQEAPGGLGCGLTPDDMAAAGQVLRDFTERSVLPKVEERIARLNLSITGKWRPPTGVEPRQQPPGKPQEQ